MNRKYSRTEQLRLDGASEQQQHDDAEKAIVGQENYDELVRRMGQYGIVIRAKDMQNWRPTKIVKGDISGVAEGVSIIMTDGLLGYFVSDESSQVLCGHIDWFVDSNGDKIELHPEYSYGKPKSLRAKKKQPQTQGEKAHALLKKLLRELD